MATINVNFVNITTTTAKPQTTRLFTYKPSLRARALRQNHAFNVVSNTKASSSNLPVLDFAKNIGELKQGTTSSSWHSACSRVREALEEHGCFVVSNYDSVSPNLREEVYGGMKQLFDLPIENKKAYNLGRPDLGLGYFLSPRDPLFESFTVQDTNNVETVEDFINCMFPSSSHQQLLGKKLDEYRKQVEELQEMIMRMIFESYGVEKYFDFHKESTVYYFRLMKYRIPNEKEMKAGLGLSPHTDLTFITVLSSTHAQGLEIKGKDGNWIPVDCPPSSFLVITGDAMQSWSNGRIRSCLHRVTMTAKEARYSNGLFFMHKGTVEAPKELVDDAYPLAYKPFEHFGLLRFALSEGANLLGADRLQAYSGIN